VRESILAPQFFDDLEYWANTDKKQHKKLLKMMREICRTPFEGRGKPEPLKGLGGDIWSRRLDQTNRIVYQVMDEQIRFIQARYHYSK